MVRLQTKQLGVIIIAISIILLLVVLSYTSELREATDIKCGEVCGPEMGVSCPHAKNIPLQSYVGFSMVFVLAGLGVYMILKSRELQEEKTEREKKLEKIVKTLKGDEKKVFGIIKDSGGTIFQSELIDKTGFSKVKVSRVLDKLEGQGVIERRRRGMTNVVLIK